MTHHFLGVHPQARQFLLGALYFSRIGARATLALGNLRAGGRGGSHF